MPGWVQPPGWQALRKAVFARWGHVCWRCGAYAGTVDHVVPVILGGGHDLANLRPACGRCNSSTGATVGNRLRGIRRHGGQGASGQPWRTSRRW
jgi:5-methylcytosine-specific restriction endonuclease McrA